MNQQMNKKAIHILIFWTLFIGIGAVFGSIMMFIDIDGDKTMMGGLLPGMQVLPFANILFKNLIFPGIALLLVNGIPNIFATILLIKNKEQGIFLGSCQGLILMLWIVIQFIIYPLNIMSTIYFIFGLCQLITGYICYVRYMQSKFTFNENDYPNINNNSKNLIIYFSRSGYTKKLAYELANKTSQAIYEIKTTEKIKGNLGFWWCGRFAMHKWKMNLEEINIDLTKYDEITICTPIWVFGVSSPIRAFCHIAKGKIKKVNYVTTHFMNKKFNKITKELDNILTIKHTSYQSYQCHFGKLKEIK